MNFYHLDSLFIIDSVFTMYSIDDTDSVHLYTWIKLGGWYGA
jgi:hypothetical protein